VVALLSRCSAAPAQQNVAAATSVDGITTTAGVGTYLRQTMPLLDGRDAWRFRVAAPYLQTRLALTYRTRLSFPAVRLYRLRLLYF